MTRNLPARRQHSQRPHHGFWSAADQVLRFFLPFNKLGHKAVETGGAVIRGHTDLGAGFLEFLYASQQVGAADPVVERDALRHAAREFTAAVGALAEKLPRVGEERRLADTAGDQANMVDAVEIRETVAERPPEAESVAGAQRGHDGGHLADDLVADVNA